MRLISFGVIAVVCAAGSGACFGGDSEPRLKPEPTSHEAGQPETQAATGGATATATQVPPFDVDPLRIADDIDFPEGWHLVYESVPYGHASGALNTHRSYRAGGEVHHEVLRDDLQNDQQIRSLAASPSGVPIVLSLCRGPLCSYEAGNKPGAVTTFLQSDDLGVTWHSIGERPGEWWIGWREGKVLALNPEKWDAAEGNLIEPLDGSAPYRSKEDNWGVNTFEPTLPPGADDRAMTWSVFDRALGRNRNFAVISTTVGPENTPRTTRYFAEFDESGRNARVWGPLEYELEGFGRQAYTPQPVAILSDGRILVVADFMRTGNCTAQGSRMGNAYAVLDLNAGTFAFISDFVETTAEAPCGKLPGGGLVHLAFEEGVLWRVNTPGACLNIRRTFSLSAEVLTCASDGVLLRGGGPVRELDGRRWGAFFIPGGEQGGWADMEFVERD
jgi:hypothetical protein